MLSLDHIVVVGRSLPTATNLVRNLLDEQPMASGKHKFFGTHNHLWGMGPDCYLESIAIDPAMNKPPYPRWFGLDNLKGPPRLGGWVLATKSIRDTLKDLGPEYGIPIELQRDKYKWQISVTESGDLPFGGYGPAIIEWHEGFHPCLDLPDNNIRLKNLIIQHPAADLMSSFLGNFLNDDRIIFVQGDSKITAEIITSQGFVVLK